MITERLMSFIKTRAEYLSNLKNLTEQQQIFLELAKKDNLAATEVKTLKTLAEAERADEKAAEAKRKARKLISETNDKARKERTRNMINAAGLMGLAGLLDKKTGKPLVSNERLLGALVELANRNPTDLEKAGWDEIGSRLLTEARNTKSGRE